MNFKSIVAASLLVGTVFSAAAATATPTVTSVGTVDYTTEYDTTTSWTVTKALPKGSSYTDIYSFTLDADNEVTGSAQVVSANHSQYWLTGGTGTLSLYEGIYSGGSLSGYTLEASTVFGTSGASLDEYLEAGDYFFAVTGATAGTKGGKYEFAITAIPEPANAALLLAGLGLFGVVAKRRKLN